MILRFCGKIIFTMLLAAVLPNVWAFGEESPVSSPTTAPTTALVELVEKEDVIIADFDVSVPRGFRFSLADASVLADSTLSIIGDGCLKIIPHPKRNQHPLVEIPLPADTDVSDFKGISFFVNIKTKSRSVQVRLLGMSANGEKLFQRRIRLEGIGRWERFQIPFWLCRWAGNRVGDWSEVKSIAVQIESPASQILLDDLRLTNKLHKKHISRLDWLEKLAFEKSFISASNEGVLVMSDDLENLDTGKLQKIAEKTSPIRKWMKRVFADVHDPAMDTRPVVLLIFENDKRWNDFFDRLAVQWNVDEIPRSTGTGFAIQDIASSTYSQKYGWDRPVYLHELTHALAAKCLRIRNGNRNHAWLQEAIANYLQLCIYPKGFDWKVFGNYFSKPLDPRGRGDLKPFKMLIRGRITNKEYAQLASLAAYLLEEKPKLFTEIIRGAVRDEKLAATLRKNDLSMEKLQDDWFEWGKKTFLSDSKTPTGRIKAFALPEEWKDL